MGTDIAERLLQTLIFGSELCCGAVWEMVEMRLPRMVF
jgi:hypothetical protein